MDEFDKYDKCAVMIKGLAKHAAQLQRKYPFGGAAKRALELAGGLTMDQDLAAALYDIVAAHVRPGDA